MVLLLLVEIGLILGILIDFGNWPNLLEFEHIFRNQADFFEFRLIFEFGLIWGIWTNFNIGISSNE